MNSIIGHNEQFLQWVPRWIRPLTNAFGCANRVFSGPDYNVVFCGLNFPFFFGKNNTFPVPIDKLDGVNVKNMMCLRETILCTDSDGNLLALSPNEVHNADSPNVYVDGSFNIFPDSSFVLELIRNMPENSTATHFLTQKTFHDLNL